MSDFGTSGRLSSRSAFRRLTGNDVSGHYKSNHFFHFYFSVATFVHRRSARIKKLILRKLTDGLNPFPDHVGHFSLDRWGRECFNKLSKKRRSRGHTPIKTQTILNYDHVNMYPCMDQLLCSPCVSCAKIIINHKFKLANFPRCNDIHSLLHWPLHLHSIHLSVESILWGK